MNFDQTDSKRRLHNTILIATVDKIDWEHRKFRARRGDILTGWLPMPAKITNNYKYWYPLRKKAQILLACMSGDLNTASVVGMLWSDDVKAPDIPIDERQTTELIEFEDGTEIRYDAKRKTITIDTPCDLTIKAKTISLQSDALTHNGINIGATHTHNGVVSGGSNTGVPQ
ncbi:phage baseplate assembly protein V [Rappaport israeli]|uniref:phage baseplate assembly protein V n=1 Tax=Rappaport israeli TaxID=1839807 RepID=UPI000930966D|nr:phage baseplate assembly protein V [Rappaport israeli]